MTSTDNGNSNPAALFVIPGSAITTQPEVGLHLPDNRDSARVEPVEAANPRPNAHLGDEITEDAPALPEVERLPRGQ